MSKPFPCSRIVLDLGRGGGGVPLVGSVSHGGNVLGRVGGRGLHVRRGGKGGNVLWRVGGRGLLVRRVGHGGNVILLGGKVLPPPKPNSPSSLFAASLLPPEEIKAYMYLF